jgi:hypothetical protein
MTPMYHMVVNGIVSLDEAVAGILKYALSVRSGIQSHLVITCHDNEMMANTFEEGFIIVIMMIFLLYQISSQRK